MTSSPSPSTENQSSDVVDDAANLSKSKDSSEHVEDEEDEEGDLDFNPFLKEAPSQDVSSSLSSEIEEFDVADVVDSGENHSTMSNMANVHDELQADAVGNVAHGREMVTQASDNTTLCNNDNEPNITPDFAGNATVEDSRRLADSDDEDAIWRRTRARYSLVGSTLDELETFLQETDDEEELHNIDDEEEYRKFLAAVLLDGDASSGAAQESENIDEDEDNDADFELEIEEALGSDVDEILQSSPQDQEHEQVCRRPETRQKKRQKCDIRQKTFSGQTHRPLRMILPYAPIAPLSAPNARSYMIQPSNDYVTAFTPQQIGQLHCLIYEHVQLLVQVFSLSILEPSRRHIATQVQSLLSEMLHKRDQVRACQRVPYPSFCFNLPCIHSAELPNNLLQNSSEPIESFFWMPCVSDTVQSVIDVAPLNLVRTYMDDVSIVVQEHQQRKLEVAYDANVDKECLFPFKSFHSSAERTLVPDRANGQKSKKTIAGELIERSKQQSIALVPKEIAKLALKFLPLFNPALFPHKPPPVSVANRVLFTDSEDGLLARGLMRYNTDWKEIQKNFLPCKTAHQIFVRQKNRSCSRAPENPIKAVRRMKTSPLTPHEKALIEEGLKVYKLDWMAVWKYMVPHRDPSLLARQWRMAVGSQKSYKGDELTKAKRRLYESKRRKSKLEGSTLQRTNAVHATEGWSTEEDGNPLPGFPRCNTLADKENCSTGNDGGENNSGDDGGNNEDEAYVHEAFLADWRPGPSSISSELAVSNLGDNQHALLYTQDKLRNDTRSFNLQNSQHFNSSSHPAPTKIFRSSETEIHMRPYQAHRSDCSRLVKLAPDLPPVNLPPTVRIMSQSAFTKYRDEASNKIREIVVPPSPLSHPRTRQVDERNLVRCDPSDAVEKGDSNLQMHPLLFQDPEDGSLPYYPLNGSAGSSSSFNFFPNNSPQFNLNLFHYPHQAITLNFFNNSLKSTELRSSLSGVDFHPLLQRTDDRNVPSSCTPSIPKPPADPTPHRNSSFHDYISSTAIPPSPNELDLDIRLSSSVRKKHGTSAREFGTTETRSLVQNKGLQEVIRNNQDLGARSVDIGSGEIVMEQEELSDSEDEEMEENVEFECEEITDTEGEEGSDSDQVDNVQTEDVQDGYLQKVMVRGDDTEPTSQETSKPDLANGKDEQRSTLHSCAPPLTQSKLPAARNSRNSYATRYSKVKKPRKRTQS